MTTDKISAKYIKKAMANPRNIFFSCRNVWGKPNYINYHEEDELTVYSLSHGLEKGWKQVFPSKKENWVDLNRKWRDMGNAPMFTNDKVVLDLLVWNGKHGSMCQLQHCLMQERDFKATKTVDAFKYWAYTKDFLPNVDELSSGV